MTLAELIMLNAKDYLEISSDVYINIVVLLIAAALCVASFWINYHKTYTLNLIKQLLRREATSEEKAKTLFELHLDSSRGLKTALSRGGQLTSIVKRAGYTEPTYEEFVALSKEKKKKGKEKKEKIDFSAARFFIPEQNVERATLIKEKENPTVMRTVLVCVLILAVSVCVMLLMPELLRFISNTANK